MPKKKAPNIEEIPEKNPAAVELGRKGGLQTKLRGPEYFRKIAAKRKSFKGGRPKLHPTASQS
jgi:hypothetical protein